MHAGDYYSIILPESCGKGGTCRDSNNETYLMKSYNLEPNSRFIIKETVIIAIKKIKQHLKYINRYQSSPVYWRKYLSRFHGHEK